MIDSREEQRYFANRRRRWLNAFVLAALAWATVDPMAVKLALDGQRMLAIGIEVATAVLVLRVGYLLFAPQLADLRQRIAAHRGRL